MGIGKPSAEGGDALKITYEKIVKVIVFIVVIFVVLVFCAIKAQ